MTDHDVAPPAAPGVLEERGGYQGTHDPGRPVGLMQQQTHPAAQQPRPNADSATTADAHSTGVGNDQTPRTSQ